MSPVQFRVLPPLQKPGHRAIDVLRPRDASKSTRTHLCQKTGRSERRRAGQSGTICIASFHSFARQDIQRTAPEDQLSCLIYSNHFFEGGGRRPPRQRGFLMPRTPLPAATGPAVIRQSGCCQTHPTAGFGRNSRASLEGGIAPAFGRSPLAGAKKFFATSHFFLVLWRAYSIFCRVMNGGSRQCTRSSGLSRPILDRCNRNPSYRKHMKKGQKKKAAHVHAQKNHG